MAPNFVPFLTGLRDGFAWISGLALLGIGGCLGAAPLCLALLVLPFCGCSDNAGMERFRQFVQIAESTTADVEATASLRPGKAGLFEGVEWNTGVEADFRFRWKGRGLDPLPAKTEDEETEVLTTVPEAP
jgi:hypothetical protein